MRLFALALIFMGLMNVSRSGCWPPWYRRCIGKGEKPENYHFIEKIAKLLLEAIVRFIHTQVLHGNEKKRRKKNNFGPSTKSKPNER